MPTREASLRQQAKTNPAIAAVLRKRRKAAKKAAAKRMAVAATAADVTLAQLAADLTTADNQPDRSGGEPAPQLRKDGTPRTPPETVRANRLRAAATARAVVAQMRADGTFKSKPKQWQDANDNTSIGGRIDIKLVQLGKKRSDLEKAMSLSNGTLSYWRRYKSTNVKPATLDKVAAFLGVTAEWLQHGGDAPAVPAQLIPHAATVLKANGKHHASHEARVEHAMTQNIDTTITVLWSLLPMDAKVMVIARVAELVAMQGRKQ